MKTSHPALTPKRIQELNELAKWIDEHEAEDIKAQAREMFAEIEAKKRGTLPADAAEQQADGK